MSFDAPDFRCHECDAPVYDTANLVRAATEILTAKGEKAERWFVEQMAHHYDKCPGCIAFAVINYDGPGDDYYQDRYGDSDASYRAAMKDAGRSHLLS